MRRALFVIGALALFACPPVVPISDTCSPNPCAGDRSVCSIVGGAAVCSCREGFDDVAGSCVAKASCANNLCMGDRSVCTLVDNAVVCSCRQGFDDVGGQCVQRGPCASNPCTQPNRTVCVASGGTAVCQCDSGFRDDGGGQCVAAPSCSPNPCRQPGKTVCSVASGAVTCSCEAGLRDDGRGGCVSENPCAMNPCMQPNRSVCVASGTTAICQCDSGFLDDGSGQCVRAPSCTPNPCTTPNRTECTQAGGMVTCGCNTGFRLDAQNQCVPIDLCSPNPCTQANKTVCSSAGGMVTCSCDVGFRLDALGQCVPMNVCNPNPCTQANRAQCSEVGGVATCSCDVGFRLDALGQCVPMNACSPNPCTQPNRGVCSDVGGTAVCSCAPGFHDVAGTCVIDDPCLPNPCTLPHQTVCSASADAGVSCSCEAGYQPGTNGCELPLPPTCMGQHTTGDSYEPNECPALAKPITPGVAQAHTFAPAGDLDFVSFTADAGVVLRAEESGPLASSLSLYDSDGVTALVTNQSDLLLRKLPHDGTYYLQVRAQTASVMGATSIQVTLGADDHADSRTGAALLNPGASITGRFDFPGDMDCLAVPVQAGHIYTLDETTATDVYLQVLTGTATYLSSTDAEVLRFRVTTSETLYLCARAAVTSSTATWTLRATDEGVDDHVNDRVGAVTLAPLSTPGASLSGRFDYSSDVDCLAVPVQANRIYAFEETSVTDVYLYVLTATGTFISTTDAESLRFETSTAETLTFCTRAYTSSNLANWTLRVTDEGVDDHTDDRVNASVLTPTAMPGATVSGRFQYPADAECVSVPVQANRIYTFEEATPTDVYLWVLTSTGTFISTTDGEVLRFETSQAETLFLCTRAYASSNLATWTLRVTDQGVDDHTDDRTGAVLLTPTATPGTTITGTFDYPGDPECVSVPVTAGRIYSFDETTATDVYLWVLTATGTFFSTTDAESLRFEATTSETLFFCTRAYTSSNLSPWALRVIDQGVDDHADDRTGAVTLTPAVTPGASVSGRFDYPADPDCLAVPVQANRIYTFEETTSTDVYLWVLTATGTYFSTTDAELLRFRTSTAETLFFCTRAYTSSNLSPWTLKVTDLGTDDHSDTRVGATALTVDGPVASGNVQFSGDTDFFSFEATSVLALRAITTGIGVTVQIQNASGSVVATGAGPGTFAFALPSAGTYFVRITSASLGAYTVGVAN